MKILLAIGAGSFIGGILRYLLTLFIQTRATIAFPFGTLGVNLIGCFLMGLLFTLLSKSLLGAVGYLCWYMACKAGVAGFPCF